MEKMRLTRDRFESWAQSKEWSVDRHSDGYYVAHHTNNAWQGWQAALRGLSTPSTYDTVADAVQIVADAASDAFRKAGIEPGEWDSDDIVNDVANGIAQTIERMRGLDAGAAQELDYVPNFTTTNGDKGVQLEDGVWQRVQNPFLHGCCDCGLTHQMHWRVVDECLELKVFRDEANTTRLREAQRGEGGASDEHVVRARAKAFMENQPIYRAALTAAGAVATALKKNGVRLCDCGSAPQGICCCGTAPSTNAGEGGGNG